MPKPPQSWSTLPQTKSIPPRFCRNSPGIGQDQSQFGRTGPDLVGTPEVGSDPYGDRQTRPSVAETASLRSNRPGAGPDPLEVGRTLDRARPTLRGPEVRRNQPEVWRPDFGWSAQVALPLCSVGRRPRPWRRHRRKKGAHLGYALCRPDLPRHGDYRRSPET